MPLAGGSTAGYGKRPKMPERHSLLRLVDSQGVKIRVLAGRVWISEGSAAESRLIERGGEYVVLGHGVVVIEQEGVDRRGEMAEIGLSRQCALPAMWRT